MRLLRAFPEPPRHGHNASPRQLSHKRPGISSACVALSGLLALFLFITAAAAQTTIHVPANQPTIQAGINAASNGDTVLVAPGTYHENIDFKGKAITVTSSGGAAVTTIFGGPQGATVVIASGESRSSVLSNLTISGGQGLYYTTLGAIYLNNVSPSILNNLITNAQCYGIDSQNSSPLIQGNVISHIHAMPYECSFASGAGIWIDDWALPIRSTAIINKNIIEENTESGLEDAGGNGGAGIAVWFGAPVIENNIIRNNATGRLFSPAGGGEGGGVFFQQGGGLLVNNLIYGNTSNLAGGGVAISGASVNAPHPTLLNNTIVDNAVVPVTTFSQAVVGGQQLYYGGDRAGVTFVDNIVSGSTPGPSVVCFDDPAAPATYQNNDFYNGNGPATGVPLNSGVCNYPSGTSGNISTAPLFAQPGIQDYHSLISSPTIDTGTNTAVQLAAPYGVQLSLDLDGNPRIQDATGKGNAVIDMGAFEYSGKTYGLTVTTVLTSSLNPAPYGQPVTFTATVTNTSSTSGVPIGSVTFSDGNTVLATQSLTSSSTTAATATFSTSALTVGTHTITATYNPTAGFAGSTASLTQSITGLSTTTALTSSLNPANAARPVIFTATITNTSSTSGPPTGTITFSDGAIVLATQPLTSSGNTTATAAFSTSTLAVGTHTITATYVATGAFSSGTATLTQVIDALASVTTLTAAPNPANFGQTVTLVATVAGAVVTGGIATPTGTVTFYNGAAQLAASPIIASQATITTSTLAVGTHTLTAVYSGSAIYSTSTSFPFTENVKALPQDFTLTLASPTITIQTQHHTTTSLTLTSLNGFADSLALTCANLPAYVTCRLTPNPAPLTANGSATVSLYLDTDSVLGYARNSAPPLGHPVQSPINLALLLFPIAGLAAFSRCRLRLRLLMLCALIPASLALGGCGEIIFPAVIPPSAIPGTYTIPITATGATNGLSHSANLTLVVTP